LLFSGKYLPSIATQIYYFNKAKPASHFNTLNLVGIAIGNGWVHPILQNQAYVDYPYTLGTKTKKSERDRANLINQVSLEISNVILRKKSWII